jgi:hypothetical protein
MLPKQEAGHTAEEAGWSVALVVAAGTGIDLNSLEAEAVFLEEVSEAGPIPAAIHLVSRRQFQEGVIQDEDLEVEEVDLKTPLEGAVAVEVEEGA